MAAPEIEVWGAVAQQEVWGTEVPQLGLGAEPLVGELGRQSPPPPLKTGVWGQSTRS